MSLRSELLELEQAILAALRRAKQFHRDTRRGGRRFNDDGTERRREARGPIKVFGSGDANAGISVEIGNPHGNGTGPQNCVPPKYNDEFNQLIFLQCRCSKGDNGACKAANQIIANQRRRAQAAQSGGGSGGGF